MLNSEALEECDGTIRNSILDSIQEALGAAVGSRSGKVGKRRPRQIPLRIRIGYYSAVLQITVLLLYLVYLGIVPYAVLIYMGVLLLLICFTTFFNMAAKAHQLLTLLENSGLGKESRADSFRKERIIYLILALVGIFGAIVLLVVQLYIGLL